MLLEVKVVSSEEWYEEILPEIEKMGFKELEDLGWQDPETDGEYMGYYFEYRGKEPMELTKLCEFIQKTEEKLKNTLALPPKWFIFPPQKG